MTDARKLVLTVIDGLKPAMLERAIALGQAPALARIAAEGVVVDDAVAAFPSVTPVCAATIATGVAQDAHRIPSMNWFHRGDGRYVEYGSSFQATRAFGIHRSLTDTIYRLNGEHLAPEVPTVFERLDDADVRTAGTTYLIYRGRHRHEVSREGRLARIVTSTLFRDGVDGPRELFYADIFASRKTGCRSQLGLPGARDAHGGCVGSHLVEHDLFDFLLLSLPDNDTWSHRYGPHAQVASIAAADRQLDRVMHAAGGPDAFLDEHAVIVLSDHAHALVEHAVDLRAAFAGWDVLAPGGDPASATFAVCPAGRSAMVYALDPERAHDLTLQAAELALDVDGVDLVAYRRGDEAAVRAGGRELRFAPASDLPDLRGGRWGVEGDRSILDLRVEDGVLRSRDYPDALARLWAALCCPTAGELLVSAAPGYEFRDWGGAHHTGGGSHGSLHRSDSLASLLWCGTGPPARDARAQWSIRDAAPMVCEHFGLA